MFDSLDLTTTAAQEAAWEGPSDEDMAWFLAETHVDPMERVDW